MPQILAVNCPLQKRVVAWVLKWSSEIDWTIPLVGSFRIEIETREIFDITKNRFLPLNLRVSFFFSINVDLKFLVFLIHQKQMSILKDDKLIQ